MPTVSDRLKEEREALGLSQQVFADRCGVAARSQRNYESGERLPDAAYLAAVVAAGADVLYILTGKRSQAKPLTAEMPPMQRALNNSFEMCNPDGQKQLVQLAALLAAGLPAGGSGNQTNSGKGAVQVSGSGNTVVPRK